MADAPKKPDGLMKRAMKGLAKIVVIWVLVIAVGLVVGYRFQEAMVVVVERQDAKTGLAYQTEERVLCGKWAWDDTAGFQTYVRSWVSRAETTGRRLDEEYHLAEKVESAKEGLLEAGTKAAAKASEVAETAKAKLEEQLREKKPEPPKPIAKPKPVAPPVIDPIAAAKKRAEAIEARRQGDECFEGAKAMYERAASTPDADKRYFQAMRLFEQAYDNYKIVLSANPGDAQLRATQKQIQDYIGRCNDKLPAAR